MTFQPIYNQPPYGLTYPYGQIPYDYQTPNRAFTAAGNILPSRFVSLTDAGLIAQSIVGDWPLAVSQSYTQAYNTNYAATAGYPIETFGDSQDCWLMLGANVTAGQLLKPDDEGRGIPAFVGDCSSAKAYEGGAADTLIRVRVLRSAPLVRDCFSDWSYEFDFEFGNGCNQYQP